MRRPCTSVFEPPTRAGLRDALRASRVWALALALCLLAGVARELLARAGSRTALCLVDTADGTFRSLANAGAAPRRTPRPATCRGRPSRPRSTPTTSAAGPPGGSTTPPGRGRAGELTASSSPSTARRGAARSCCAPSTPPGAARASTRLLLGSAPRGACRRNTAREFVELPYSHKA